MEQSYLFITFWIALFLVFYSYIGYGIVLYVCVRVKRWIKSKNANDDFQLKQLPEVTLIVPAYNERSCIAQKLHNSLQLNYPARKLHLMFVTEGSTDGTTEFLSEYTDIQVIGGAVRKGKIEAINQAMKQVTTPLVVFTDANTLLNRDAILNIVTHYSDPKVGAVSGEKRIITGDCEQAAGSGEGIYWKYESFLKKMDAELNTIVGAAGELFSIRTQLYEPIEKDTLLDDFMISMKIAEKGYKVVYEPEAYAIEKPSFSVGEEMKRKVRICTGGFQAISRLKHLLNPFKYGLLTFQYLSHRVFRWTVAPLSILLVFFTNLLLIQSNKMYEALFILQSIFYMFALLGFLLERSKLRIKALFVPFYFSFMNYTVFLGFIKYITGTQTGIWEKVKRA